MVLEFSANDQRDVPYSHPERKGYEQLIRKLLKMPGRWAGAWRGAQALDGGGVREGAADWPASSSGPPAFVFVLWRQGPDRCCCVTGQAHCAHAPGAGLR